MVLFLANEVGKQESNEDHVPCKPAVEQDSFPSMEQGK